MLVNIKVFLRVFLCVGVCVLGAQCFIVKLTFSIAAEVLTARTIYVFIAMRELHLPQTDYSTRAENMSGNSTCIENTQHTSKLCRVI